MSLRHTCQREEQEDRDMPTRTSLEAEENFPTGYEAFASMVALIGFEAHRLFQSLLGLD